MNTRGLYRRFWLPLYRRWALRYQRRERTYRYAGLRLRVPPGVFHPGLYFSTPVMLRFLATRDLRDKTLLDVGTGSGLLALYAARQGASATALDLHPLAATTARRNAAANGLPLNVLESDLFEALPPGRPFEVVLVNPPYYPLAPRRIEEHAFYAGEQLEYFQRFFAGLGAVLAPGGRCWMVLSEDCAIERISGIARSFGWGWETVFERKKWGESLFVVEIGRVG
ncbi:MAG TPA: methyltransferase [Saprospiraceae bacterium]|nr:methyltransferase [Saprospiraceae bacterium]